MMAIFSCLHPTIFAEKCCNTLVLSITLHALWDSAALGITVGDKTDISSAKGHGSWWPLRSGVACRMIFRVVCRASSRTALAIARQHLCRYPSLWLYRRVIRDQQIASAQPCSPTTGDRLCHEGWELTSHVSSPREMWDWESTPWTSAAVTQTCALGPKLVTTCYRVVPDSYMWHSMKWAGALGAAEITPLTCDPSF